MISSLVILAALRSRVDTLLNLIEGRQFMAHANSILDTEGVSNDVAKIRLDQEKKKKLIDRLDEYYEDPELAKGRFFLSAANISEGYF